jgi:hypothetical protein
MKYKFIPGLELNRKFYKQVVGPLLKKEFPKLKYAAALTGNGSDVLGFDDPTSMDHNWGPKMRLILPERNFAAIKLKVDRMLKHKLPYTFMGFPTNFSKESDGYLKQSMQPISHGPVNHLIRFYTPKTFFKHYLGFNPYRKPTVADWLTFPEQALLEVSAGEIFHDNIGFEKIRNKFLFYPKEVWRYIMLVQWSRITNELSFHARTGEHGDELGSRVIASRMVRRIIKLVFLIESQYSPYAKWYGAAFDRLPSSSRIKPTLLKILDEEDWQKRQNWITKAHIILGRLHNERKITKPQPLNTFDFNGRNYKVFDAEPIRQALDKSIRDPKIKNMRFKLGAVDQFIDHTRINHEDFVYRKLKFLFQTYK